MVFLAAVHDELLRDPGHALAAYYPTVGGEGPGPGLAEALTAFCAEREERIAATLVTRTTQTNETARCSALLPAFAAVGDGRPLALIEMGASAGLNLRWDRYAYDYGGGRTAGAAASPLDRVRARRAQPAATRSAAGELARRPGPLADRRLRTPPTPAGCTPACGPTSPRATRGSTPRWRSRATTPSRSVAATRSPSSGPDRRGAGGRARVRLPHRCRGYFTPEQIEALRALLEAVERDVAWIAGEASGCSSRTGPRPMGRPALAEVPWLARNFGPGLRADRRPAGRARQARPHGPPRRLAGVAGLGLAALPAPGGVADHVARVLEVRGPGQRAAAEQVGTRYCRVETGTWSLAAPCRARRCGAPARRRANGIVLAESKPGPESGPKRSSAPPG